MTKNVDLEPWRGLSEEVAAAIEPELEQIAAETIEAIAAEVPEYARPLEGSFGRGVRTGVGEALRQFVALIRDPDAGRGVGREVYVGLGRGELRQGRTLDSLQAAYRVGARVAWRRFSVAGRAAGLDAATLSLLAEAIFVYIDELSADSVEGYAEARAELEDRRRRLREELAAMLVGDPPAGEQELRTAAGEAGWDLPKTAAAAACPERELGRLAARLPGDSLAAVIDGVGCAVLADPAGPGRRAEIERAAGDRQVVLGPGGALARLGISWRLARAALAGARDGALPATGFVAVEDRLTEVLLLDSAASWTIAERALAPLAGLTEKAEERMCRTALAYLRRRGNSVEMARELHVHPQTARYRIARLRELFGERLDDPDARLELELALRARGLSASAGAEAS
jgi:PucR C-terminal helix-turn-helix domain